MYYLDQVFHIQYPFYHSSHRRGRGWLFAILRQVKTAYHAALALSEHHQHSMLPQHSSISSSTNRSLVKGKHYDLALEKCNLALHGPISGMGLSV
jgi:hypothetical protein